MSSRKPTRAPEPAGENRIRRFLVALILIASSSLLAVGVAEIALRVFERLAGETPTGEIVEFSESLHHRLTPGTRMRHRSLEFDYWWINNSMGMRDRERAWEKEPGVYRIAFIGDSMIAGHGVSSEKTAAHLLETRLNEGASGTSRFEVFNAGVFSYSPVLEYLYLREIIGRLSPDLVLVALTLANDVGDDHYYATHAERDADGRIVGFDDQAWPWSATVAALEGRPPASASATTGDAPAVSRSPVQALKSVLRGSRLAHRLKDAWESYRERSTYLERREREFEFIRSRLADIDYNLGLVNYRETDPEERERYWKTSTEYLRRIVELAREHDTESVLIVIPPMQRLTGETELQEPYEVLEELGRQVSVPVIQLLPAFLQEPPTSVYYEYDHHWTERGNEVAADVILEELVGLGVLPWAGESTP